MSYKKTTWVDYETTISAEKLNKIEDALETNANQIDDLEQNVNSQLGNFSEDDKGTLLYKGKHITPPNVVIKSHEETIEHRPDPNPVDILAYSYEKDYWPDRGGWQGGVLDKYLPNPFNGSVVKSTGHNVFSSAYMGLPFIKINFRNTNIFEFTDSNKFLRHLSFYVLYNNTWTCIYFNMVGTCMLNAGFRQANINTFLTSEYNIHNIPSENIKQNKIIITKDLIDSLSKIWCEATNKELPFDIYQFDEIVITGTISTTARPTENIDAWIKQNADCVKLSVQEPQESTFEHRFQIDSLRVSDDAAEKFDSVYLNNIIASLGQFKEGLDPKNFTEHNDLVTTYVANAAEDTDLYPAAYEGKYLNGTNLGSIEPLVYVNPSNYAGYAITKLLEIDLANYSYHHTFLRHWAIYDEKGVKLYYGTNRASGIIDKKFCEDNGVDTAKVKYFACSNTGANRTGFKLYYEHYNHYYTYELPYLQLSPDQLPNILNTVSKNTISLYDVDRIVAIGDSYTESHYTIKDKSWMSKLSELLDYNMDNFAISGDTYRGQLNKIRTGNYSYASTSGMTWEELHPTHAIMISKTNDTKYMDCQQFIYDMLSCIDTIHGMGCIPIIASEYHVSGQDYVQNAFNYYAEKYGGYCIDLTEDVYITRGAKDYKPFWGGSHPGTRPNHLFVDRMYKDLSRILPRPYAAIKIYRPRELKYSTGTNLDLDKYLYVTSEERAKLFKEISICHSALRESKYYDTIVKADGKTFQVQGKIESEYFKLMKKKPVEFNRMCLIDAILPTTINDVTEVTLNFTCSDANAKIYVKDVMATPYPSPEFCRRFDIPSILTDSQVKVGNTYTSSNTGTNTVYKVVEILHDQVESSSGFVDGTIILCSGNKVTNAYSGSVLTLKSGTGDSTLTSVYDAVGFSSNYPSGKQDVGHYILLNENKVSGKTLRRAMAVDDIKFLIVSEQSNFTLTNISIDFVGQITKQRDTQVYKNTCEYLEKLSSWEPLITSSKWTKTDVATTTTLADSVFPLCPSTRTAITTILSFNSANSLIKQNLPAIPYTSFKNLRIKVVALARYFPPIFNPDISVYPNDSIITDTSFDYAELKLYLGVNNKDNVVTSKLVGLHWTLVEFDVVIPAMYSANANNYIKLMCDNSYLQLASVDVFLLHK